MSWYRLAIAKKTKTRLSATVPLTRTPQLDKRLFIIWWGWSIAPLEVSDGNFPVRFLV